MKIERIFSSVEEEKLYSTGNNELDDLLERAFCEGYEYAQREFAKTERKFKVNGGGLDGEFTLSHEYTPKRGNGIISKARNWFHGHTSADSERVLNTAEKDIRKKVNSGRLSKDLNSEVFSKELAKSLKKGVRKNQLGKAAMIATPIVAGTTAYGVSKAVRRKKKDKEENK